MRGRTFAPVVLVGLCGSILAAVAAGRGWARAAGDAAGVDVAATVSGSDTAPLALALALVALAAWGVVLVMRGRVRRGAAVLGALASAGVLAAVVLGAGSARSDARTAVTAKGATGDGLTSALTGWYWTTGVAAALALAAFVVAVARSPGWPAMGSRYESPAGRAAAPEQEDDLWRALDEGRDPTT